MRFVHHFARRIICEVTVNDDPPAKGKTHTLNFEWSRFPKMTRTVAREYVTWICSINQILADKWDMKLMHCVEVGLDVWELWAFTPGEAPRLLETLSHKGGAS
jgi:hypothetical protein